LEKKKIEVATSETKNVGRWKKVCFWI